MARREFPRVAYLVAAATLFAVEILIALFVRDGFIRPYIGDVLAVALVYAALRAVTPLAVIPAIAVTLAIALAIEIAQAFNLLGTLGLDGNQLARTVFGSVFEWMDLAAYATGAIIVVVAERVFRR